ncbi:MAG: hypothetical protein WCG85_01065 [Polyangia bacterium]
MDTNALPGKKPLVALALAALGGAVSVTCFVAGRGLFDDPQPIQRWLSWLQPRAVLACAAMCLLALLACRSEIRASVRRISRRHWLVFAGVLAVVAIARLVWVPATERLYFDEHAYRQMADSIVSEGRSYVVASGRIVAHRILAERPVYEHWPAGWPTALAVAQGASGERGAGAALNLVLSLATSVLVALIAASQTTAGRLPLIAGSLHACVPAVALWSRTGSAETMSAFLAAAAVLFATIAARVPTLSAQVLVGAICALAAMTRNEFLVLLPAVLWIAARTPEGFKVGHLPAIGAIAAWLLPVQALHLGIVARGYDHGAEGAGFSLSHMSRNLGSLGAYLSQEPVLLLLVLLAVPALRKRSAAPLVAWVVAAMAPATFYFAGSLAYPGGERFVLAWAAPCALLAAITVVSVERRWLRWSAGALRVSIGATYVVGCAMWLPAYSHSADEGVQVPRREIAALRRVLKHVPPGAVVASAFPFVILAERQSAESLTDSDAARRLCALSRRHALGVYLWLGPTAGPDARLALTLIENGSIDSCSAELVDVEGTSADERLYRVRSVP